MPGGSSPSRARRRFTFSADRRVGEYAFRICGDDPSFLPLLEAIYPNSDRRRDAVAGSPGAAPGPRRARGEKAVARYRMVREPRGRVAAYSARRLLKRGRRAADLLVPLEWTITYDILQAGAGRLHLHGGGFRCGDGAVVLPGAHGAGKTSLTLEALHRGYAAYSDEIVVFDTCRERVLHHPRCFVVKEPGMRLFPRLQGLYRARAPQKVGGAAPVWYVNPRDVEAGHAAAPAPARWLVFPRFVEGAATEIEPIDELDAVGRLLGCVFSFFADTGAALTGVAALARGCRAWRLTFGDLGRGFDAIETVLARRSAA